jgi:hypothetical protein
MVNPNLIHPLNRLKLTCATSLLCQTIIFEYILLLHPFGNDQSFVKMAEKSDKAYKYRQEIQQVKYP